MCKLVYLPNEIFHDFYRVAGGLSLSNIQQHAFAYAYYYFNTYMYQYCQYLDGNGNPMTQDRIKQLLGYSPINKNINFVIKKNGFLDSLGYTETTKDYPLTCIIQDNIMEFITIQETKTAIPSFNDRNFKIKKPMKAFYRTPESQADRLLDGTFYAVENCHAIDYYTFQSIIMNPELNTIGFYIYGYINHKSHLFKKGYQSKMEHLATELNTNVNTTKKYLYALEKHGFITITRNLYSKYKSGQYPNIYKTTC